MDKDRGGRPRAQGMRPEVPLTADRVVQAAIELIDRDGAETFSIRSLARYLGVYPSAIYHHVRDRRRLLSLIVAAWMGEVTPAPDLDAPLDWLRNMAYAYRSAVQDHPDIARLITGQLMSDVADLSFAEMITSHLEAAGVPDDELAPAYNASIAVVVGFVDLEFARVADPTEEARRRVADDLENMDPDRFPTLHRHADAFVNRAISLRWSSGDEVPLDESFEFLVDTLIDGLRRRAERARSTR